MYKGAERMRDGVRWYSRRTTKVTVSFPEGREVCQWCPLFLRYEEAFRRYSCRLTGEWIPDPFGMRGARGPLEMERSEG